MNGTNTRGGGIISSSRELKEDSLEEASLPMPFRWQGMEAGIAIEAFQMKEWASRSRVTGEWEAIEVWGLRLLGLNSNHWEQDRLWPG